MSRVSPPWSHASFYEPSHLPTMVTAEERRFLYWLGRDWWRGDGGVIEFGPWLGATTHDLASGLRANPNRKPETRLYTVDNFKWRPFMEDRSPLGLRDGESFRSVFERNLREHHELLHVLEARLPDDTTGDIEFVDPIRDHDSGLPVFDKHMVEERISLVFIDGAKSWMALAHLLREVAPLTSPGALYVFQDFKSWSSYWVPMCIQKTGAFTLTHVLPLNTVTFVYIGHLPEIPTSIDGVSVEEGLRLLSEAAAMLHRAGDYAGAATVSLSMVAFLAAKGEWEEARAQFRSSERRLAFTGCRK